MSEFRQIAKPADWWNRERTENGLRRYARDFFAGREMNLPQTGYAYRYSVPEDARRSNRHLRLYPPLDAVLRVFESLLDAWQQLGFAVFYFPAKTRAADIAGWRFGRLVAVEYSHSAKGSSRIWKCLCRCGKTAFVAVKNLIRGRVVSCGCYNRTVAAKKCGLKITRDLRGQRFGRLTAVEPVGKYGKNQSESLWKCVCDCGRERNLPVSSLTSRGVRSCGCLRDESSRRNINNYRMRKNEQQKSKQSGGLKLC